MASTTLKNPLDKFATYSIHHILLACRTTEEAKEFMSEANNGPTLAAIDQVKQLGDPVPIGKGNTAYLVIDTRRFAQFSVEKLQYDVFINGLQKEGSHGNLATTINMTIMDAVGVSFINFIQWLMNEKMQTNFDGMIFMHRTIFVGHEADGKTSTVQSITIPMHLFKLELALDSQRGIYTAEFMPNMNFDTVRHHRWLTISNASKYFTGKGINKLGPLIESFEDQLNKASSDYWQEAQKALKSAGRNGGPGRKVQYQITIPGDWYSMEFTGANSANATETVFSKLKAEENQNTANTKPKDGKVAQAKDGHVSVETGRQITEVLDFIFKQVTAIADLGAGRKTVGETGSVTFYKHFVGITSDDSTVIVHVDVVPFEVPNVVVDKGGLKTVSQGDQKYYQNLKGEDGHVRRIPSNYMEFDYIFTGNNKDILNFDLKLQDLQFMLASQLNLGPGVGGVVENTMPGAKPKDENIDTRADLITMRPFDALLMPKNTEDELRNFKQYTALLDEDKKLAAVKASNDYMKNLSMYYAMAPITAIMTIRGNPDVMTKFNQNSFLDHTSSTSTAGQPGKPGVQSASTAVGRHAGYRAAFENNILKNNIQTALGLADTEQFTNNRGTFRVAETLGTSNYATMPVFVTVNVMGPKVDYKTGQSDLTGDFAERLLFDNFYVVMKVTNVIERNSFTQQLELYSHNIFGMGKLLPPGSPKAIN